MLYTGLDQIDLQKYQRLFVFGCSFTKYHWSTWADIVSYCMPHAEYHNLAITGAGQMYIQTALSQADTQYKFNENDLVLVMWSTFYRFDVYTVEGWRLPGNIYSSSDYPEEFVHSLSPRGFVLRDLGIIDIVHKWFERADFDAIGFLSLEVPGQQKFKYYEYEYPTKEIKYHHDRVDDLCMYYHTLLAKKIPETTFFDPNKDYRIEGYHSIINGEVSYDYHPSIVYELEFLEKVGLSIPQQIKERLLNEHVQNRDGPPINKEIVPEFMIQ